MLYFFFCCGTSKNSSYRCIVTEDLLSYARPFVTAIVSLIESVVASVVKIPFDFDDDLRPVEL